jgi:hypothetical protein
MERRSMSTRALTIRDGRHSALCLRAASYDLHSRPNPGLQLRAGIVKVALARENG